jgi:hypothetical protein
MPPSGMDARLAMDSRRRDSRQALLPLRAIDFLRAPAVLAPSEVMAVPSRFFLTMYGFYPCQQWLVH